MKTKLPALLLSFFMLTVFSFQSTLHATALRNKSNIYTYFSPEKVVKMRVLLFDSINPSFGDTVFFGVAMAIEHEGERYSYGIIGKTMYCLKNSDAEKPFFVPKQYTKKHKRPFFWKDFDVTVSGGRLTDSGAFVIDKLPRNCPGGVASVTLTYKQKTGFIHTGKINLFSAKNYSLNLSGRSGYSGRSGSSGNDGQSGTTERPCQSGGHGSHGSDGFNGNNGHEVNIFVKEYKTEDQKEFLQVYVLDLTTGRQYYYFMDYSSTLRVYANGGAGGYGGRGGDGGNGGRQGQYRCFGGDGGDGGNGANGGDGGIIRIFTDTSVNVSRLQLFTYNSAGSAGEAGRGGNAGEGAGTENSGQRRNNAARPGRPGRNGMPGTNGPRIQTTVQPLDNSMFRPV
jgi:hypothetical protein